MSSRLLLLVLTALLLFLITACDDNTGPAQLVAQTTPDAESPEPDPQPTPPEPDVGPEDVPTPSDVEDEPPAPMPDVTIEEEPPDPIEDIVEEVPEPEPMPDATPDVEEDIVEPPETIAERCFPELATPGNDGPVYDTFMPIVGSHCSGTNHQDIEGIEQVVFFGDSVTQGTPNDEHLLCIENEHFYRNLMADFLVNQFDLEIGDLFEWGQWRSYSCLYNGEPGLKHSGDFSNCSKWGARTDDFLGEVGCNGSEDPERCCVECCSGGVCSGDGRCIRAAGSPETDAFCGTNNKQLYQCLPEGVSDQKTLFVFTMGGNDIASITQDGAAITSDTPEGAAEIEAGYPSMWAEAERTVAYLEEAIKFLKDPARFPNGSYVVFGNPYEFTDGTGDVSACSPDAINIPGIGELDISALGLNLAELGGFGSWERPEVQAEIVIWITEQYMRIAVEYRADMTWMLESFCGHGYVAAGPDPDMNNACYREDDPSLWFDISCIHPNERGHRAIFELFRDVVLE